MNINCFKRPKKPLLCKPITININLPDIKNLNAPKLLSVSNDTECHVTPLEVALRMVGYLDYEHGCINTASNTVLEPSAGTGNLINALLNHGVKGSYINAIEKNNSLFDSLSNSFNDSFVNLNNGDFLLYPEFINQYDRVIANPPFKPIIKHIQMIYDCLKTDGVAVCLVPVTYNKISHETLEILPVDTFINCKVSTKIIRITKI